MGDGLRELDLFTDGACSGNPGPGGWAFLLRDKETGKTKEASGAEAATTNNRMELLSVIRGLESLDRACQVRLVTDSSYVSKGISEWMAGWKSRGWMRKEGRQLKPVKNVELWQRLDELLKVHRVTCQWVRGHAGHPENERCDLLAVEAYRKLMEER